MDLIKIKNFRSVEGPVRKMKRGATEGEKNIYKPHTKQRTSVWNIENTLTMHQQKINK